MGFIQVLKSRTKKCDTPPGNSQISPGGSQISPGGSQIYKDTSGIALFIVLAAVMALSILVTEFTYVSQITQEIAFGSLDQVKAHYLAKSALKLSLLRLKAYKNVKDLAKSMAGGAGSSMIPKGMIEQIWSFPFFYPIPANLPGLSQTDKDAINKFQKDSGFDGGNYTANIASESSKYNLNLLLQNYVPIPATAATQPTPTPGAKGTPPADQPSPSPSATTVPFDRDSAREGLYTYLNAILVDKSNSDNEFGDSRRNFRLQDLIDNISSWADNTFERRSVSSSDGKIPFKRAPFYSVSELHMIPTMDDELYNLFSPALTTSTTNGININTMTEPVLRALIPGVTTEEVTDFFKFRDALDSDNKFKAPDDFFAYIQKGFSLFVNKPQAVTDFKTSLTKQNITLITDESQFKITIQANVGNSYKTIEAWVELSTDSAKAPAGTPGGSPGNPLPGSFTNPSSTPTGPGNRVIPPSGIRITFMRII